MEADFMARRALFLNSLNFLLLLVFSSCTSNTKIQKVLINKEKGNFIFSKDRTYLGKELFTGYIYALYPSGDTSEISGFLDGKEHGVRKKFYPGGKLREQREFSQGEKTGIYCAWWDNGNKMLFYHFKNDEYDGICQEWNPSGRLVRQMTYVNGHEEGRQKLFYDNGKVRANYIIVNGRRYGLLGTKNCTNVSDSVFKN